MIEWMYEKYVIIIKECFKIKNWRLPTLPRSCPRSTIGVQGLNFSVRNGKRCNTLAIVTKIKKIKIIKMKEERVEPILENHKPVNKNLMVKPHDLLVLLG